MAKGNSVSAEVFCMTWKKNCGDSIKVAEILNQTRSNVVNRYKKYRELGINLCEMKEVPKKRKIKLIDMVPELNKMLAETEDGN